MTHAQDIRLNDREFNCLATFIRESLGIKMPPSKRTMLEVRLASRVRTLGMRSFDEYCALVFNSKDASGELTKLVDAVTTNKTEFFREKEHFDWLTSRVLGEMVNRDPDLGQTRPMRVWSAGCSSGEEPYTLSMVLAEYAARTRAFSFEVVATDVSSRMLEAARKAVYREASILPVPRAMLRRYFLRSKDRSRDLVRVAPALRRQVRFAKLNLLEPFGFESPFDAVFCRNVLIYFDRNTQTEVLRRMCATLSEGGYLFVGHSETLHGMHLPLRQMAPSVYVKETDR